jgi:hypothetical protein
MAFKFEILILGQEIKMDINKILFIYLPIMDEYHPMIYLINPIHKWNSSMQSDIHSYEIIHLSLLENLVFLTGKLCKKMPNLNRVQKYHYVILDKLILMSPLWLGWFFLLAWYWPFGWSNFARIKKKLWHVSR